MPEHSPEVPRFTPPEARPARTETPRALAVEEKQILDRLPLRLEEETVLELKRIAQVIAGDLGMRVKLGKPGKGSFFDPERSEVTLDPLQIAENPAQARMVAAHEGAHRRLSRGPKTIGVKPELIEELYGRRVGFSYISNAIEDPAVNSWVKREFEGLRPDFDATYSEMFAREHAPLGLDHPEIQDIIRRTGTIPNLVWFGSELIRYWQTKRFSKGIKGIRPKVTKALGKALMPAIRAFGTLPEHSQTEPEVIEKARERFRIVYQDIWRHLQPLVEEDLENEARRRMLEDQLKKEREEKGLEGAAQDLEQGATGTPLDALPKKLREELAEAIRGAVSKQIEELEEEEKELAREAEALRSEREEIEKKKSELEEKKNTAAGAETEDALKEEQKIASREAINNDRQADLEKRQERLKQARERLKRGACLPIEINDFSEALQEEVNKGFARLPRAEQDRLRAEAESAFQEFEDVLNKTLESHINPDLPESHAAYNERQVEEEAGRARTIAREREFEETKKEAERLAQASRTEYDRIRAEMDQTIEDLYHRLEEFFLRERHPKWRRGFRSGPRIVMLRAMEFALGADPDAYRRMFERKTTPTRHEYKFSLVVDLSESMKEGNKILETRKGLVALAEVLNRLGINFEIIAFNEDIGVEIIKDFEEDFEDEARNRLTPLVRRPSGDTPTTKALSAAHRRIRERAGKDNFIVVLTDGQPDEPASTKRLVRKILKDEETRVKVVGVGLGSGTGFVRELFPSAIGDIEAQNLPEALGSLLEQMIVYPELFEPGEETKERFIGG